MLPLPAEAHEHAQRQIIPVRERITVQQIAPITFGTFASYGSGGSITIDAHSGARSASGAISILGSGDYGQAEFIIAGQPEEEILVSPPPNALLSSGSGNMMITDFKISPSEIITLNRQGIGRISVGGALKVPGNAAQGKYTGYFNISVNYSH